jgi:hypothetical protein
MDIALKKLDLMQRLMLIWDEAALKRVAKVIEKEVPVGSDDDITDEELAMFDRNHAAFLRGDLKTMTGAESVKRLRKAQARDEAL